MKPDARNARNDPADATERRTSHATTPKPERALPHERDQSDDTALHEQPSPEVIRRAAQDLEAGLVDTDLHGTPGAGSERRDELLRREAERTRGQP